MPAPRKYPQELRDFTAEPPNQLWVVDFTYVATWSGLAFTAFISHVFSRRIVGWRPASSMPAELPLDALEMALWTRSDQAVDGLLNESVIGICKTECVRRDGPWRGVDGLELATLSWVDWFNTHDCNSSLGCHRSTTAPSTTPRTTRHITSHPLQQPLNTPCSSR